jgi:hypothetical protein
MINEENKLTAVDSNWAKNQSNLKMAAKAKEHLDLVKLNMGNQVVVDLGDKNNTKIGVCFSRYKELMNQFMSEERLSGHFRDKYKIKEREVFNESIN